MITIAIYCTSFAPNVAFTVSFQAPSFPTIATPNILSFEYFLLGNLFIPMSFLFYMLYCFVSLTFVFLSIVTIFTFTLTTTFVPIMKTRTIHLQASCFCTTTGQPFLISRLRGFLFVIVCINLSIQNLFQLFTSLYNRISEDINDNYNFLSFKI